MTSAPILRRPGSRGLRRGVLLLAALCVAISASILPARAQTDQMALEADQLVYDYDANLISAVGNVVVEYLNYVLTADRLTFYQTTGRLVAVGHVHIVDANGNVFDADQADVTKDFRDGFVQQLYVTTADHTFFTAETSQRHDGNITEFFNSTYTACEVTFDEGQRPPLWRVSAARIIHNEDEQMIYFERARLEFLGIPVAFAPRISTPDPSVTRATGFLVPEVTVSSALGFGVGVPFFWAIAPNYDLTLTPTYFTKAGALVEAEWRHRMQHGLYTISSAGIDQKPMGVDPRMFRGAIRSTGEFDIGRFWEFGWDGTLQTDRSFTTDYGAVNPSTPFITSQMHITGVLEQTYFDAHSYYFANTADAASPRNDQARQGAVPADINFEHVMPFIGGQLTYTSGFTAVTRGENDPFTFGGDTYYYGLAGVYSRLTQELMWQRQFVGQHGQVFTPFAFGRADLYFLDLDAPPASVTTDSFAARITGGGGIEWSWPFLIQTARGGTHIIEPVVQFVARPSEAMIGALPNEDAQSVIFDTTDLLSLNRFSGGDRFEGGTRLVVMLRYVGEFGHGGHVEAVIGKSYQLAGTNSYVITGVNSTGIGTGLESAASNIVAALSATDGHGRSISLSGRFDPTTFELQRALVSTSIAIGPFSASTGLMYERSVVSVEGVPGSAFLITGKAAVQFAHSWTLSGSVDYDAVAGFVTGDSIGLRYECDCATMAINYSKSRSLGTVTDRRVMFSLELRTLGDFNVTQR